MRHTVQCLHKVCQRLVQPAILRAVSEPGDRWRIKEFAALVGVQEETLRAWERRYDLLPAGAQHRRLPAVLARRTSAASARCRRTWGAASRRRRPPPSRSPSRPATSWRPPIRRRCSTALVAAAEAFDATRFDALLDAALTRGTVAGIRDVVLPILREIGRRWERNELTVGQEHFASHLVERRLLTHGARAGMPATAPLALLACPSGERHTLGLVCFGLVLADRGWRIAYLGADTPIDQVADMSRGAQPGRGRSSARSTRGTWRPPPRRSPSSAAGIPRTSRAAARTPRWPSASGCTTPPAIRWAPRRRSPRAPRARRPVRRRADFGLRRARAARTRADRRDRARTRGRRRTCGRPLRTSR